MSNSPPDNRSSDQWVSIEARLPEADVPVLGYNGRQCAVWIYSLRRNSKSYEWHSLSGANFHRDITHWMPLPEPPK